MDIACDAVIILGERYHKLALEMAEKEENETRKAELLQIAANLEVVPAHKPQTYWQGDPVILVHSPGCYHRAESVGCIQVREDWISICIRIMRKMLRLASWMTRRLWELLECLWVKFYNQPAPVKVGITLKESATYTDFANINTGGVTPDGREWCQQCQLSDPGLHGRNEACSAELQRNHQQKDTCQILKESIARSPEKDGDSLHSTIQKHRSWNW